MTHSLIASPNFSRRSLRKELRARRRALSPLQQRTAAQQLARQLRAHPVFLRSQHIAFYMATAAEGEINVHHLMERAAAMGKRCYLPVLHPFKKRTLWFVAYKPGDVLRKNFYGLSEPEDCRRRIPAWALDLVLMPLVGFDRQGNRLGMGGGFYDRSFAFRQRAAAYSQRPALIGVAHSCQEVDSLASESWDIPLDYVATEREIICAETVRKELSREELIRAAALRSD